MRTQVAAAWSRASHGEFGGAIRTGNCVRPAQNGRPAARFGGAIRTGNGLRTAQNGRPAARSGGAIRDLVGLQNAPKPPILDHFGAPDIVTRCSQN